jgi:hypothetical protein
MRAQNIIAARDLRAAIQLSVCCSVSGTYLQKAPVVKKNATL